MSVATGLEPLLSAEHAAIYGYGIAGATLVRLQASVATLGAVRSGFDAHRQARDQLTDAITAGRGVAPPALAAYQLPFDVTDVASAMRLLTLLEDRVSAVATFAVGASKAADRGIAADVLSAAAVRAARLRLLQGTPTAVVAIAFPGLPAS
jgi:hypothetical protein